MNFSKNKLKYWIAEKNVTSKMVADYLNIDESTLSRKMSGASDFNRQEIVSIKEFLGLSTSEMNDIFLLKYLHLCK